MAQHQPVDIDPNDVERAHALWGSFTQLLKWSVIGIIISLVILMALFIR